MAALDAGTLTDPDIAGIHALLEIKIGNDDFRQIAAGADDARKHPVGPPRRRGAALFRAVRLGLFLYDAAAAIETIGCHTVAQVLLTRLRIGRQRRRRQPIVRTVHAALRWGLAAFLYGHDPNSC